MNNMMGILEILICLIITLLILGIMAVTFILLGIVIEELCDNNNGIFHRIVKKIFQINKFSCIWCHSYMQYLEK